MYYNFILPIRDDSIDVFYRAGPLPPYCPGIGPFLSSESIGVLLERTQKVLECTKPITVTTKRPEGKSSMFSRALVVEDSLELKALHDVLYGLLTTGGFTSEFLGDEQRLHTRIFGVGHTGLRPGATVELRRVIVVCAQDPDFEFVTTVAEVPLGTALHEKNIPRLEIVG